MTNTFYCPQMKLRKGNVFTPVCHSVHNGMSAPVYAGIHTPPWADTPWTDTPLSRHSPGQTSPGRHSQEDTSPWQTPLLWADTPLWVNTPSRQTPPMADTPEADTPQTLTDGHCCGRYTSYWNAFLLSLNPLDSVKTFIKNSLEFFLNGAELSLNSANSRKLIITEA